MLLDSWRLALGTLTAVPTRPPVVVDGRRAALAMALAPLAAVPLGVAVAIVGVAGHRFGLPAYVVAVLALGVAVLGNRAFHIDGLSDTVDGLAASYDRDRSLEVMKTGTSGPAGTAAVVFVLGLQAAGLASVLALPKWWQAAVLGGVALCAARAAVTICCLRGVVAARSDGLGRTYTQTVPRTLAALVWLLVAAALAGAGWWAGLAWWRGLLAVGLALVVVGIVVARAVRRFGGVTGDVFGAGIELALATLLVALA